MRRSGLTVRVRITLGVGFVFALALVSASGFLVARQRGALTRDVETTVGLRAADLVASLEGGALPASIAIPFEDGSFVQVVDEGGAVIRSSPNIDGEPPLAAFPGGGSDTVTGLPVGDTAFYVAARTAHVGGAAFTVYVGASLEPVTEAVRNLTGGLALGGPLLLGVVLVLTWLAVGRALRPVEAIRAEVATITERELHRRVPQPAGRDEIGRLATTMNSMLDRLDESAARKRRFLADASHELRSPLAGIRSQLEVDLAHPGAADWQRTERDTLEETLRMQRLVDDLLTLAHHDESLASTRRDVLDLDDVVLNEVRRLRTRGKVAVDASNVAAVQIEGDADSIRRAIRNLLDNAERHAASGVTVTLAEAGANARIVVSDDGPGVAEPDRQRIFERFARADMSRSRADGASGLGLAIVSEIVAAHHGTVLLEANPGGATFAIELPRAEA